MRFAPAAKIAHMLPGNPHRIPHASRLLRQPWEALIGSEKSCFPKAKSSKINILDSNLYGNDDFPRVSLEHLRMNVDQIVAFAALPQASL